MRIIAAIAVAAAAPAVAGPGQAHYAKDIVGQTSTATVIGGGNPIYVPPRPQYNNVVGILMDYGADGAFVCSGTLVANNRVVTAAHCVSDGTRARPLSTTVFFTNRGDDPVVYAGGAGINQVAVTGYKVNPLYTGEVIDENDIAVLRLATPAPSYATAAKISKLADLTGVEHIVAGYGARSNAGGSTGTLPVSGLGTGRLRYAGNRFEVRIGDPDFGGRWAADLRGPTAAVDNVWMSDFDNGTSFRDQMCNVAASYGLSGDKYCNLGIGAFEGIGAGGDSGGAYFVDGELAAVHSFALWYRDDESANRFGQFKGAVSTAYQAGFLASAIPEPATWAMMIIGFGLVGSAARRRTAAAA